MADKQLKPYEIEVNRVGKLLKFLPHKQFTDLDPDKLPHLLRKDGPLQRLEPAFPEKVVEVVRPSLGQNNADALASERAGAALEKDVEDKLAAYIPHIEKLSYQVAAQALTRSTAHWSDKVKEPRGPIYIAKDLINLWERLRTQMGESTNRSGNDFALVIPAKQIPYLQAKNSLGESAFAMFQAVLPKIELIAVPQLQEPTGASCALLICKSKAYGPAGYVALHDGFYFRPLEGQTYKITIPERHLVLANPEQMAVLTGI